VSADYYSILEVWPTASVEEIKKNYFRLAKLYHPDAAGDTPENRERFKQINEAYAVLSDAQKRVTYDESLRKTKNSKDGVAIQEKDRRSAMLSFSQAKEAMRSGRFDKAALLFKAAIKYDPSNPAYHSWYGFCLGMLNTRLHEARDACRKAIQMEFYNADYHANLGFVYFKAGLKEIAIKHFKEALKWDPDNPIASKYVSIGGEDTKPEIGPIDKIVAGLKGLFSRSA
jgi:tetratricopeptide (TPR) repeat protein